jgi:hypothetical protein
LNFGHWRLALSAIAILAGCGDQPATNLADAPASPSSGIDQSDDATRLFVIGQDLDAIRGYTSSDCCVKPDGTTAYLDFYDLVDPDAGFGGLGIDLAGDPVPGEADWGGGPANAYKTATGFDVDYLAIGLSITENEHPGGLDELVAGERDAEIRQLAMFADIVDATILLRVGYEFDGAWNQGYEDAPRYIAAFQEIVDGLRDAGANNIEFVWQGAASTTDMVIDGGRHDNIRDWYPGDDYVDWLAISWFMHPDEQPGIDFDFDVLTPAELSDEVLELAREVGKPVLIAEASPQGYDLRDRTMAHHSPVWDGASGSEVRPVTDAQVWDDWFQPLFDYMNDNRDVIRGFAYINIRWDDQDMWDAPYESGYWGDTRVEVNDEIAGRFTRAVTEWRDR